VSTAAKVFVVLLVLFSVAFAMVTVTFVVQQDNWKELALDYRAAHQAARVEATSIEALAKTTAVQLQGQITQLARQIETLNGKLADADAEIKKKDTELIELKSTSEAARADANRAIQLQELDKTRAERLEKRNGELLAQTTELQKRNLDLDRRVQELTQQVTIMDEQVRALKEQRYALEQQLAAAQKTGAVAGMPRPQGELAKAVAPLGATPTPIKGRILEVKDKIASISVGSADGVTEGMNFIVYRGATFLGKLRITMVEPNGAGGDLVLIRGEIRPEDLVKDEASFGMAP